MQGMFKRPTVFLAALALGAVPAQAANEVPNFSGKCTASSGYASLNQTLTGIYATVPVACTGVYRGAAVTAKPMVVHVISLPALVACKATSVGSGLVALTTPTGGASASVNGRSAVVLNNRTRTLSIVGTRIAAGGLAGTINGRFRIPRAPEPDCQSGIAPSVTGASGSITFG